MIPGIIAHHNNHNIHKQGSKIVNHINDISLKINMLFIIIIIIIHGKFIYDCLQRQLIQLTVHKVIVFIN